MPVKVGSGMRWSTKPWTGSENRVLNEPADRSKSLKPCEAARRPTATPIPLDAAVRPVSATSIPASQ